MGRTNRVSAVVAIAVFTVAQAALATTYYVPGSFSTIQAAVNVASSGDIILVDGGTYTSCITTDALTGSTNCIVVENKDICLVRFAGTGPVVVDPGFAGRGLYVNNATVHVRGFVFSHCQANGPLVNGDHGGGVAAIDATVYLQESGIRDNRAVAGGGLFGSHADLDIRHCSFDVNDAQHRGGGCLLDDMSDAEFSLCTMANNHAEQGGALAFTAQ